MAMLMNYPDTFQKIIIAVLTALMALVVMIATLELVYIMVLDILSPPFILLDANELLDIFGYFLLILIGIELLETFRIYLKEGAINAQVVLLVAIIALARKVIILGSNEMQSLTLVGIGFIILALAAGYYLVKKSNDDVSCKRL
jgi:LPXTG-motif cell wall-anchored protein